MVLHFISRLKSQNHLVLSLITFLKLVHKHTFTFTLLNSTLSFQFWRQLMTNWTNYSKICKKDVSNKVEMVDISQSSRLKNTTCLPCHLRGRARSENSPIFVDLFSTWIHRVGNFPISPDPQIGWKITYSHHHLGSLLRW